MVYFNELTHLLVQEKLELVDYEEQLLVRLIKLKIASREMVDERKADNAHFTCEFILFSLWKDFFKNMIIKTTLVGVMLIVAMWVQKKHPNFYQLMRSQNQTDCLFE